MNAFESAAHIARCLDEDALPYAIGGALALTAWSIPRDTKDVDLSIYVPENALDRVFDALERAGVMIDRTAARREQARIGLFYGMLGHTRVDVFISSHPHFVASAQRRVQVDVPTGGRLWFLAVEDLVILKLLYARAKD